MSVQEHIKIGDDIYATIVADSREELHEKRNELQLRLELVQTSYSESLDNAIDPLLNLLWYFVFIELALALALS